MNEEKILSTNNSTNKENTNDTNVEVKNPELSSNLPSEGQKLLEDAENIIAKNDQLIKKHSHKKLVVFIVIFAILALFILAFSTVFALTNINNDKIINGIQIQGIDVSNLTAEEATEKVSAIMNSFLDHEITIKHDDFTAVLIPKQFGVSFDVDKAITDAYSIGRSGNIFKNNFEILNSLLKNNSIFIDVNYDESIFSSNINEINGLLPDKVVNSDYYVDGTTLYLTRGKDGVAVDEEKFKKDVLSNLEMLNLKTSDIDIPVVNKKATQIDIDAIYKEVHKDPVDAYYTTNPYVVYPSSTGLDFDISLDEVKQILSEEKDEYEIPLKVLYPSVSTNDIGNEAFPDMLSKFSTSFTSSNSNRSTNIRLAAQKINGTVLMPGETFSYNQVVGKKNRCCRI